MQRYFVSKDNINEELNQAVISGDDFHHVKVVMRMHNGDKVILCTEDGFNYLAEIITIDETINLKIIKKSISNTELDGKIYFAQGLVRREKSEEVLRRLVELGASGYLNVEMERSVVKSNDEKNNEKILLRRNTIIKEASEQSERSKLMNTMNTMNFKNFINFSKDFDIKLVCYEESGRSNDFSLKNIIPKMKNKSVIALIGPEGGISQKELNICLDNGFIAVGLGKRILRTETAPLFLMSVIAYSLEMED